MDLQNQLYICYLIKVTNIILLTHRIKLEQDVNKYYFSKIKI